MQKYEQTLILLHFFMFKKQKGGKYDKDSKKLQVRCKPVYSRE